MTNKKLYYLGNFVCLLRLHMIIYFCSEAVIATFNHKILLLKTQYLLKSRIVLFHAYEIFA
jgi:hypothetical protein